ncbi:MAG TPA: signal peptide peptidase SppA, partial [Flavisolibacter sp.]|nr:signal peptide peptidase SppA [Flavisolibacter sp.]
MNHFLKIFLASLLALIIFSVLALFMLIGFVSGLARPEKEKTGAKAVLVVDMAVTYPELSVSNPFAKLASGDSYDIPSLYDVVRMIRHAKSDSAIKGIYIKCGNNGN